MRKLFYIFLLSFIYSAVYNVPESYSSIQSAIENASNGDSVIVSSGLYVENINYNGKDLVIVGEDPMTTFIEPETPSSFTVSFHDHNYPSTTTLQNFTIQNGTEGISMHNSGSPTIRNCIIRNTINGDDGGMYIAGDSAVGSHPLVEYCLIYNNFNIEGSTAGGGIRVASNHGNSSAIIRNCTIVNNSPEAIHAYGTNVTIENSIIWNNVLSTSNAGGDIGNIDLQYSIDNNIDPLFVDPENGDFTLMPNSPCIDSGNPESNLDPDGTISDIGAYYFHQCISGDLNDDQEMNVTDVVILIQIILGHTEESLCGDINADGDINIFDVVMLINNILDED